MEGKKFDWKDKKIIIITCSLFLNLIFGSAAYTYYGQLTELRDVEQRNETLIAENTGLQQTNEDLQEENEDLQIQIDDLQPKVDALNSQVQTLTTEKTNLQNQVSSLTDSNKSLQSQIDNLKNPAVLLPAVLLPADRRADHPLPTDKRLGKHTAEPDGLHNRYRFKVSSCRLPLSEKEPARDFPL